jgi:hypothetical protein
VLKKKKHDGTSEIFCLLSLPMKKLLDLTKSIGGVAKDSHGIPYGEEKRKDTMPPLWITET